jgi:hypothetical protein
MGCEKNSWLKAQNSQLFGGYPSFLGLFLKSWTVDSGKLKKLDSQQAQ